MIEAAGFVAIKFSSHRYDSFSDAPFPSADAVEFGKQGVDILAFKSAPLYVDRNALQIESRGETITVEELVDWLTNQQPLTILYVRAEA